MCHKTFSHSVLPAILSGRQHCCLEITNLSCSLLLLTPQHAAEHANYHFVFYAQETFFAKLHQPQGWCDNFELIGCFRRLMMLGWQATVQALRCRSLRMRLMTQPIVNKSPSGARTTNFRRTTLRDCEKRCAAVMQGSRTTSTVAICAQSVFAESSLPAAIGYTPFSELCRW